MTIRLPFFRSFLPLFVLALLGAAAILYAQIEGSDRGVAPINSAGDFEVADIKVDVAAGDAAAARYAGWRMAQRLAWRQLWSRTNGGGAPALSDSQLEALVSGIEIVNEQIGPNRYIATLAVLFDRARTGQILGVRGQAMRSPPLLVVPVTWSTGAGAVFEYRTEWQKAWARFRTADSAIDYVRTSGAGADALLLNAGQISRRSRTWWRILLDQYGAADVIIPIARIERSFPGGPVIGKFSARYGPDNALIGTFTLRAASPTAIPQMMDQAIKRMDDIYTQALFSGQLRPDPSLIIEEPVDPELLEEETLEEDVLETGATVAPTVGTFSIQFDTPGVASVSQGENAVRSVPGVLSANTSSLALGGTSVMQVSFDGNVDALRMGLQARGWTVTVSGNTLRIVRRGPTAPPVSAPDTP